MEKISFSKENYDKIFNNGYIKTPLGTVKLGDKQFNKLKDRERTDLIGAVYQTLNDPVMIIHEVRDDGPANLFVKSFVSEEQKLKTVISIVVKIDNRNISISTYKRDMNNILGKIKNASDIIYEKIGTTGVASDVPEVTGDKNFNPTDNNIENIEEKSSEKINLKKALPTGMRYMNYDDVKFFENMTAEKPIIYLDMDGVIADFEAGYRQAFDRDCNEDDPFTVQQTCISMPNFFRTLPVIERGRNLFNQLHKKYDVIFLTTPMEGMEYCKSDKATWLQENFPGSTLIFSDNKADYADSSHSILIDDMGYNLDLFADAGGTALNFTRLSNDEIMEKIESVINPAAEVQNIKQQLKNMKVEKNPTEKQKETGLYKKGKVKIKGLTVMIENPKGSIRWGIGENGRKWLTKMKNHYGYILHEGTGADGDKIDCFIGDNFKGNKAFVINQGFSGLFDEHKVMIGFQNKDEALKAFLSNYEKGWEKNIISIEQTNISKLRKWLDSGNKTEPFRREAKNEN